MPLPQDEIKRRISAARIIRGMSQAEFDARGAADGFGKGEMSRVERGELQFREGKHLDAMCRYLEVPAWWFTADTITMPDDSAAHAGAGGEAQLDRIERMLTDAMEEQKRMSGVITDAIDRQFRILDRLENALDRGDEATIRADEILDRLDAAAAQVVRDRGGTALEGAPQQPGRARSKTGASGKTRASRTGPA